MDNDIPVIEMTASSAPRRRGSTPNLVAAGLAMVLAVGGGVALLADDSTTSLQSASQLPKLKLSASGAIESRSADASLAPLLNYKYTHTGAWPNLPTTAPVYKLVAPNNINEAEVARIAAALGVNGAPQRNGKGWRVVEGTREVAFDFGDGGYSVALYGNAGVSVSGSSGGSKPTEPIEPDRPADGPPNTPTTIDPPSPEEAARLRAELLPAPKHLPDEAESIKIVRELVAVLALDGAFEFEAMSAMSTSVGGACADGRECAAIDVAPPVLYSRSVVAHRLVDGQRVSGFSWSFEIGDNGTLQSAYGTLAELTKLGDYPLRAVQSAYDDIVSGRNYRGQPIPLAEGQAEIKATANPGTPSAPATTNSATTDSATTDSATVEPGAGTPPQPGKPGSPEPDPTMPPGPTAAPVTFEVTVTGVKLASQLWFGFDGTTATTYIVPMYSFAGTVDYDNAKNSPWTSDNIALDQSFIDETTPPPPSDGGPKVTIEPPIGGVDPGFDPNGSGGSAPIPTIETKPVQP